jgi:hypothetical protein
MYHLTQDKRFPNITQREKDQITNQVEDIDIYRLARIEQSAELFSIKYLENSEEIDPKQKETNIKVANEKRARLDRNLKVSRSRQFLKSILRRVIG